MRHLVDGKIVTDFLCLRSLGSATAAVLAEEVKEELKSRNIPLDNCVGIMSDSAHVMRGAKGGLISFLKKEHPQIVDIGGCCMHHVHNAASDAMSTLGHDLEDALDNLFMYLRYAKSAQAFEDSQRLLDLKPLKFLRRVESRLLQIHDVLIRFLKLYDSLKCHFYGLPTTERRKGRVKDICRFLDDPESLAYIHFVVFALGPLKKFELLFQTSKAVIHLLHDHIVDLISSVCHAFIRAEFINEFVDLEDVISVPVQKQLPDHGLLIGDNARIALRNDYLTATQIARFYNRVREFYGHLLKSLVHHLPVASFILRAVQFLDPSRKATVSEKDMMKLKKTFLLNGDNDDFLLEWRQFLSDEVANSSHVSVDLPAMWMRMKEEGKFPLLVSIAERALILPHGNAETERVFSLLKRVLKVERNRLQDPSINGLMTVKSFMLSRS